MAAKGGLEEMASGSGIRGQHPAGGQGEAANERRVIAAQVEMQEAAGGG